MDSSIGVRLGEYDLKSTEPDCEGSYCSPPVQDSYISRTIVHPDYNPKTHQNDIALIQISKPANFTSKRPFPIKKIWKLL